MAVRSIAKKDAAMLKRYVTKLDSFMKGPDAVALRICECCIQVTMPSPEELMNIKTHKLIH